MFKTSILIGTMLASNLAGVCCAAGMPMDIRHHGMMDSGYFENVRVPQIQSYATHCNSQAENVSLSDRDLVNGCGMDQRLYRGAGVVPLDFSPAIIFSSSYSDIPQNYYRHGCGFHFGAPPPQILEQSTGNQLLF